MIKPNMYVAGGAVRDLLMGEIPRDIDYVCVGLTAEQLIQDGFKQIDASFPVFIDPNDGSEVALARRESSTGVSHTDFEIDTSNVSLEEDLKRRDLTINAMAMDADKNIIDPFGGQNDIKNKVLRHTSDAFFEDPLRVLRLARFQAKYPQFRLHESTIKLVREHKEKLRHLTPERVRRELEKALVLDYPSMYFRTLDFLDVLDIVHPELNNMKFCRQKPQHHAEGNVFLHSMMVLDECCKITKDPLTRLGAIYHDLAKYASDVDDIGFHKGHDSLELLEPLLKGLKTRYAFTNAQMKVIQHGCMFHMKLHKLKDMKPSTIAGMINDKYFPKTLEALERLLHISLADSRGRITIGYKKSEINFDAFIKTFKAIKAYSPLNDINEYNNRQEKLGTGKTAQPDLIQQFIHKYSIKCVEAWLIPSLNFNPNTRALNDTFSISYGS